MPIIDYICANVECGTVDSTYIPSSQCGSSYPETETTSCSRCGGLSERNYSGASPSIGFLVPPVVHYNRRTGQYSIPGHRDDPVDPGYEKVEIRDMRMYSKLTRDVDAMERNKAQFLQAAEKEFFDARLKEQREDRKRQIEKAVSAGGYWAEWTDERGIQHREWRPVTRRALAFSDAAVKFADNAIAQRRRRVASGGANFHSRILEHSKSEQSVVDGAGKKAVFFFPGGRR